MSIAYRCDRAKGITYTVWHGVTTAAQWLATTKEQIESLDWPGGDLYLTDLSSSVPGDLGTSLGVDAVARKYEDHNPHSLRMAIVAPSSFSAADEFQKAISKRGSRCMVFTHLDTACVWLGINFEETENILRELRSSLRERTGTDG
jgi:hypothetical protein